MVHDRSLPNGDQTFQKAKPVSSNDVDPLHDFLIEHYSEEELAKMTTEQKETCKALLRCVFRGHIRPPHVIGNGIGIVVTNGHVQYVQDCVNQMARLTTDVHVETDEHVENEDDQLGLPWTETLSKRKPR